MAETTIELRHATARDQGYLLHCIQEAYHEFPRLLARGEDSLAQAAENDYEHATEGVIQVAMLEGRQVGAAWWLPGDEAGTLTAAYYVEPDVRGRGIATRLLEAGMAAARQRGVRSVAIRTHPENAASIALARKVGFEPMVMLLRKNL